MTTSTQLDEKTKQRIKEPLKWKVVLLNDDATPMDFVVNALISIFKHTEDSAEEIMLSIHHTGSGIAGIYNFEIAEAKAVDLTQLARSNGYPLQVKLVEE